MGAHRVDRSVTGVVVADDVLARAVAAATSRAPGHEAAIGQAADILATGESILVHWGEGEIRAIVRGRQVTLTRAGGRCDCLVGRRLAAEGGGCRHTWAVLLTLQIADWLGLGGPPGPLDA